MRWGGGFGGGGAWAAAGGRGAASGAGLPSGGVGWCGVGRGGGGAWAAAGGRGGASVGGVAVGRSRLVRGGGWRAGSTGAVVRDAYGGFPSASSSLRVGPAPQGRSLRSRRFAISLRSTLDRPSRPGHTKTAGKPPKERAGPSLHGRARQRPASRPGVGSPRDGPTRSHLPGRGKRSKSLRAPHPSASPARLGPDIGRPRPLALLLSQRPTTAWVGHRPPTTRWRFSFTRPTTVRGWAQAAHELGSRLDTRPATAWVGHRPPMGR